MERCTECLATSPVTEDVLKTSELLRQRFTHKCQCTRADVLRMTPVSEGSWVWEYVWHDMLPLWLVTNYDISTGFQQKKPAQVQCNKSALNRPPPTFIYPTPLLIISPHNLSHSHSTPQRGQLLLPPILSPPPRPVECSTGSQPH